MLVDDARRLAAEIEERLNASACQGVNATVKAEQSSPQSLPAGAGRPVFTSYFIQIDDGSRIATLTLGQAAELLNDLQPEWDADRLFDELRARDIAIEEKG